MDDGEGDVGDGPTKRMSYVLQGEMHAHMSDSDPTTGVCVEPSRLDFGSLTI